MPKGSDIPSYRFQVEIRSLDGLCEEHTVHSAYFQDAGVYTVFKDADHAVIQAFRTDLVTRIVRTGASVVG